MSDLKGSVRTNNCGELGISDIDKEVVICGWVNKYRNLGGLHFIDVRDKYGITQLGFESYKGSLDDLKKASLESVIKVSGKVKERPESAINKKMSTGMIEVEVLEFELLSQADKDNIPFLPFGATEATEDLRLKYRYLDLRTKKLQDIISLRSKMSFKVREILHQEEFVEVETPVLYKSTPEGARDYIVPSRVHPGKVYALPQSPQTLKQLLMIGGTDKYFQIVKCFRDEDLRADRQPEFTQIDMELSFTTQEYIKNLVVKIISKIFKLDDGFTLPIMDYKTAIKLYGTDKPDLRFGLQHMEVTGIFKDSDFSTFASLANEEGLIKAIKIPESMGGFSRKVIDSLVSVVKPFGGRGVAWFKITDGKTSGGISKFIDDEILKNLEQLTTEKGSGTWFFLADGKHEVAHASADALRRHLGKTLNIIEDGYKFIWIYDFPLLEWSDEENRFMAVHHPFTLPKKEFLNDFLSGDSDNKKLAQIPADAYDLICNGHELGGGSMRIYQKEVQNRMFEVLGMSQDDIEKQFGFFVEALRYGVPPHGGFAFGFDRVMMLLVGTDSIKDVIAFPKTTSASDLMSGAPSSTNGK